MNFKPAIIQYFSFLHIEYASDKCAWKNAFRQMSLKDSYKRNNMKAQQMIRALTLSVVLVGATTTISATDCEVFSSIFGSNYPYEGT